jgi:hypothetical protein
MAITTHTTEIDKRYNVTIKTAKTYNTQKKLTCTVKRFTKGTRWAEVTDKGRRNYSSRSNAQYVDSDGNRKGFKHVDAAEAEALKFANGGTWDFDSSYQAAAPAQEAKKEARPMKSYKLFWIEKFNSREVLYSTIIEAPTQAEAKKALKEQVKRTKRRNAFNIGPKPKWADYKDFQELMTHWGQDYSEVLQQAATPEGFQLYPFNH